MPPDPKPPPIYRLEGVQKRYGSGAAAVFALPFFQLYYKVGLFDTHIAVALAHCLFNVPLAVWILEGFMSGVPREIDETAYVDGHSFPSFFTRIFSRFQASSGCGS